MGLGWRRKVDITAPFVNKNFGGLEFLVTCFWVSRLRVLPSSSATKCRIRPFLPCQLFRDKESDSLETTSGGSRRPRQEPWIGLWLHRVLSSRRRNKVRFPMYLFHARNVICYFPCHCFLICEKYSKARSAALLVLGCNEYTSGAAAIKIIYSQ